jgi:Tfp pilus assembly protein PilF
MKKIIFILLCCLPLTMEAQTYLETANKAIDYTQKDSLLQAETLFKKAIAMEPNNEKNLLLYCNLAYVQRKMGHLADAADSYTFALKRDPSAYMVMLKRAAVYMDMGITSSALADYEAVLKLSPDNKEALLVRAYLLSKQGDYEKARNDYNHILSTDIDNYDARLGLALLAQKRKDFRKAMEMLNLLIKDRPNTAVLYYFRASVEQDITELELAMMDVDRAIALDNKMSDAYILRGDIHMHFKKKDLARQDYIAALKAGAAVGEVKAKLERCK